ncbi:MAG: Ku protein [Gemmatimonadaceae bacterium]
MASIWKGTISFGLVTIPVEMRSAVRTDNISFRLLHAEDMAPVKYERVCASDGETVPWNEIVKGYEYAKGKFVVLTDEDFKAAALESSRTVEILDFVKGEEIDPRFFETPYYLVPSKGGEKAYALLREAIRRTGSVGVGKVTIRQSQHLVGIRTVGEALVLEMMRFANELVDASEYTFPPAEGVRPQELQMAEQLIGNLAEPFSPEKYTDDYRGNLMKIIRAKMKGKKVKADEPEAEPADTKIVDLMARLRASLDQGKPGRSTARGASRTTARGAARAPRRSAAALPATPRSGTSARPRRSRSA